MNWLGMKHGKTGQGGKTAHGGFFGRLLTTARIETSKTSPRRLEKYGDICRPGREISAPRFGEAGLPFTPLR